MLIKQKNQVKTLKGHVAGYKGQAGTFKSARKK